MRTDALLVCASLACLTALPAAPARAEEDPAPPVALRAVSPDGSVLGPCPLEHTDVRVEISGYVARTRVTHRFANPYDEPIEALYTFPLPEGAAVRDMEMQVGERLVRAEIRRRQAAREEYEAARRSGQTASLLDQERPNIFTTSVANVRPGVPIRVTLEYVETLPYEDGVRRLVFPMTVGPRYVPGTPTGHAGPGWSPDTTRVPDASRITPPTAPPRRSGHDIAVAIDLDAGVEMGPPRSPTHDVHVRRIDARRAHVELAQHDRVPNRDLVLEWPVSPERIASGVLAHRPDEDTDGYLTLLLQPNASPPPAEITPKEIVFVMDTSGSMNGPPMAHSRALMGRLIRDLHPQDSFAVLRYDTATSALSPLPLENTPANRRRALAFIDGLEGSGGTDALAGLRAAFAYPRDPSKLRIVVFLTDGYIGNEREILDEIQRRIGAARLFSFGVGSSVNRYLLEEMAREGRGDAAIVTLRDAPEEQVTAFYKRLQSPYLTDIEVDWGGLAVDRRFPERIPDLFAGQPLEVHARYRRAGRGTVRVRGRLAGRPFEQTLEVELPA
ncbi:MAG TPA: VIT domain-containing protein, partial [Polyangiaceae bacterium LLY-WYZ-15_(1-7)]|nr:VIT domain-containing protein [Polyangiaceae bacterium LLY-WYZ-15_(1-7)]